MIVKNLLKATTNLFCAIEKFFIFSQLSELSVIVRRGENNLIELQSHN